MNSGLRNFFLILGIITAAYILLRYIIPLALKFLLWTLGFLLNFIIMAAVVLAVIWLIVYIFRSMEKY